MGGYEVGGYEYHKVKAEVFADAVGDVVSVLSAQLHREALATVLVAQEERELAFMAAYPDAWNYGRHADEATPVKVVHYLLVGGEYVGRHRQPSTIGPRWPVGTVYVGPYRTGIYRMRERGVFAERIDR